MLGWKYLSGRQAGSQAGSQLVENSTK